MEKPGLVISYQLMRNHKIYEICTNKLLLATVAGDALMALPPALLPAAPLTPAPPLQGAGPGGWAAGRCACGGQTGEEAPRRVAACVARSCAQSRPGRRGGGRGERTPPGIQEEAGGGGGPASCGRAAAAARAKRRRQVIAPSL